jgi:hypothetical protein
MKFDIQPYAGVGPIRFGMLREDVREALRVHAEAVDKTDTGIPSDFFESLGIFVYYRPPECCEAVELFEPASPEFDGTYPLGRPYREMEHWMRGLDSDCQRNDAGVRSFKFGFGLYAPSAQKEPDLPVEGVIVFEKGYYEN